MSVDKLSKPLSFFQACFITGMSSDSAGWLKVNLTDREKEAFIHDMREAVTDERFEQVVNDPRFPNY